MKQATSWLVGALEESFSRRNFDRENFRIPFLPPIISRLLRFGAGPFWGSSFPLASQCLFAVHGLGLSPIFALWRMEFTSGRVGLWAIANSMQQNFCSTKRAPSYSACTSRRRLDGAILDFASRLSRFFPRTLQPCRSNAHQKAVVKTTLPGRGVFHGPCLTWGQRC